MPRRIPSMVRTSPGFGAGTFAARSEAENIGVWSGACVAGAGSVFCANEVPATRVLNAKIRNACLMLSPMLFRLFCNVQENSHARERDEQRRSAVRNQWQ